MFVNGKYVLVSHDKKQGTPAHEDCGGRDGNSFSMKDRRDLALAKAIGGKRHSNGFNFAVSMNKLPNATLDSVGENVIVGVYGQLVWGSPAIPSWSFNSEYLTDAEKNMIGSAMPGIAELLTVSSGGVITTNSVWSSFLYLCHSECPIGKGQSNEIPKCLINFHRSGLHSSSMWNSRCCNVLLVQL